MKKLIFLFIMLLSFKVKAQYIAVPDNHFVLWLQTNIPAAMNGNQLDTTSTLVTSLKSIDISGDSIEDLYGIQFFDSLEILDCGSNLLTDIPTLPALLQSIYCGINQLTNLPTLPGSIRHLYCYSNMLTTLPALPNSMVNLLCDNNQLTGLPVLPNALDYLSCSNNHLTTLPTLPVTLHTLECGHNQITDLPVLPNSLQYLFCSSNLLTSLPELPNLLYGLQCDSNSIYCFPLFPASIDSLSIFYPYLFDISGNPFNCLPNYILSMNASLMTYPLCHTGNTNSCPNANVISGYAYNDIDNNCVKNTADGNLINIPLKLYDSNNSLLGQVYSNADGVYYFRDSSATYTVSIDTTNLPLLAQCIYPGIDSTVIVNGPDTSINFALGCKPTFDIGVQSVVPRGWIFPGQQHQVIITAGDLSKWYNLSCANGIGGQIQVTVTGPVTYNGITAGALTPNIAGNIYTYNISDYDNINNQEDFGLLFYTNTSAQAGDVICIEVDVLPTTGDNCITNNSYQYCYPVGNSYDPNKKEVYPVNVPPEYNDWLTYTIHFQNTGNAPAFNIRLKDTLDTYLDRSTFQVINYSHQNETVLNGNVLTFNFHNILLADSSTDPEGSKGFIQYRIKPLANLSAGTQIKNTAYIYFDYNAPIVTNTTVNEFVQPTGIKKTDENQLQIYPNPNNGKFVIQNTGVGIQNTITITNILGELILNTQSIKNITEIDLSKESKGIYFVTVKGTDINKSSKVIVE